MANAPKSGISQTARATTNLASLDGAQAEEAFAEMMGNKVRFRAVLVP